MSLHGHFSLFINLTDEPCSFDLQDRMWTYFSLAITLLTQKRPSVYRAAIIKHPLGYWAICHKTTGAEQRLPQIWGKWAAPPKSISISGPTPSCLLSVAGREKQSRHTEQQFQLGCGFSESFPWKQLEEIRNWHRKKNQNKQKTPSRRQTTVDLEQELTEKNLRGQWPMCGSYGSPRLEVNLRNWEKEES